MSDPSINTEAYTRQQVQIERHEAVMAELERHAIGAPTGADIIYHNSVTVLRAALEVLEHFEVNQEPSGLDDKGRVFYEPTVVPHGPMARLYAVVRASGAIR